MRSWSPLWTYRFVATEQPWPQSSWVQYLGQPVNQTKAQDGNDWGSIWLMYEFEDNSVIDDRIDRWCRRLGACIRATGGHFEYSLRHKLVETLLTECDRLTAVAMKQTLGRQVVSTVLVKHILLLQCGPQAGAGPGGRRLAPACGLTWPAGPRWPLHAGIYQRRSRRIG